MTHADESWRLSREEVMAVGVVVGFIIGLRAGPVVKVLTTIALFCSFALFGRVVERHFESRFGLFGFFAVVALLSSFGGIKDALEGVVGVMLFLASIAGLAVLGGASAGRLYDAVTDGRSTESAGD